MARVKGALATRKRRKRVLKLAKGYRGAKSKLFRTAKQAVMKSLVYAYTGRKLRKRDFRKLWITRISAAAKMNGINYSRFMNGLKKANIDMNRKMLSNAGRADRSEAELRRMNDYLRENLSSAYTYIDMYSYLKSTGYSFASDHYGAGTIDDGLHYTAATYKRIYAKCLDSLKRR